MLLPGAGEPPRRADGTLAGSALRMDQAVANMVQTGADDWLRWWRRPPGSRPT